MKKIRFTTLSQQAAEDLTKDCCCIKNFEKPIMISITSPAEKFANIQVNIPILRLQFDDLSPKDLELISPQLSFELYTVMDKDDVVKIFQFIEEQKPDMIITHCKAGVCRSQAVNAALSKIILEEDDRFFKEGVPNMHVYTSMLNYWFGELYQCSDTYPDKSAHKLYPWIYKQRVNNFKKIH